jgi:hypothetical protein
MEWCTAECIFRQITKQNANDPLLAELQADLIDKAIRYARIRADWELAEPGKRLAMDEYRKRTHDSLIDGCNILGRTMAQHGLDASWRDKIGQDRRDIGDFACYIHCLLGLAARDG